MNINDEYDSFCFDEVCAEIFIRMNDKDNPETPKFAKKHKKYNNFSDFYKQFDYIMSKGAVYMDVDRGSAVARNGKGI